MAYLDTGELPWDMDLFDKSIEVSIKVHVHVTYVGMCTCGGVTFGMCHVFY